MKYTHRLFMRIPRFFADEMESGFTLQEQWTETLRAICERYEYAIGSVKMDFMALNALPYFCPSGAGIAVLIKLGEPRNNDMLTLPGYAWGMCINKNHLVRLGGPEKLQETGIFHIVKPLGNGGVYLQLTPDVNIVKSEENRRMAEFIWPALGSGHMDIDTYVIPSYRLFIPDGELYWDGDDTCSVMVNVSEQSPGWLWEYNRRKIFDD